MIAEGTLDELRASINAEGATLETVFSSTSQDEQHDSAADSSSASSCTICA